MNKIQKLFITIVSLLATTNVLATDYHITIVNSVPANGRLSLSENSDVTSGTHASNTTVTIYAKPAESYYLEEIVIEYVMDIDGAESRGDRADPTIGIGQKIVLNKTSKPTQFDNNKANRYGGAYTFTMPSSHVEITATFRSASNFEANENIILAISGGATYDGVVRDLVVTNTLPEPDETLIEGTDFSITSRQLGGNNVGSIKDAGNYTFTIQGLGTYYGSKTVSGLTIEKAALTITPKNKSRQYRNANPPYANPSSGAGGDFTYTGLQNGETNSVLTTQPSATIAADINSNVGNYTVTALGAAAANYNISYTTGTLTITQRNVNDANTHAEATLSDNTYTLHTADTKQYYEYNSNSIVTHQPTVSVIDPSDNNKALILDADFSVAYGIEEYGDALYQTPGMYTATITFIGNYTGNAIIKQYQIRKPLTLANAHKWHTYYETEHNLKTQDGFEAYIVSSISNNVVGTQKKNYVKKDIPMLLYRTGDTQTFYPELVSSNDGELSGITKYSDSSNGSFEGVNAVTDVTTLAADGYDLWILVNGEFVRTKSGNLPAHRCYLKLKSSLFSAPSISLSRGFDGDDITEIHSITHEQRLMDNYYYDLNGRRVLYPTKGIYILNGKKIIFK